jgi:hypothetical protein
MLPITLPILVHNDDTICLKELDLEYDYEDLTEVEFVFFTIDFACRYAKQGREYCEIVSGEDSFVANITFNELKDKLNIAWQK